MENFLEKWENDIEIVLPSRTTLIRVGTKRELRHRSIW